MLGMSDGGTGSDWVTVSRSTSKLEPGLPRLPDDPARTERPEPMAIRCSRKPERLTGLPAKVVLLLARQGDDDRGDCGEFGRLVLEMALKQLDSVPMGMPSLINLSWISSGRSSLASFRISPFTIKINSNSSSSTTEPKVAGA